MTTKSGLGDAAGRQGARRRRWGFRLAAIAASLLILATGLEAGARVLGLGYGNSPALGHPTFHHWRPSNYAMRVWGADDEYGGFVTHFNADGFGMKADLPPAGTASVVLLGASFVEARQIPEEQRFVTLVGRELGIPSLNFGCSSFSPMLSRLQFDYFRDRVSPVAVVLLIYSNDIEGDANMAKLARHDEDGRIVAVPGVDTPLSVRLARRSYFARYVRKLWMSHRLANDMNRRTAGRWEGDAWAPYFPVPLTEYFSPEELARAEREIAALAERCGSEGCPFLLSVVPDRGSLLAGAADRLAEHFARFAERRGLFYVDLVEAFRSGSAKELFFAKDIHFSPKGHELVGRTMAAALRRVIGDSAESTGARFDRAKLTSSKR